jgi:hypothetical protein
VIREKLRGWKFLSFGHQSFIFDNITLRQLIDWYSLLCTSDSVLNTLKSLDIIPTRNEWQQWRKLRHLNEFLLGVIELINEKWKTFLKNISYCLAKIPIITYYHLININLAHNIKLSKYQKNFNMLFKNYQHIYLMNTLINDISRTHTYPGPVIHPISFKSILTQDAAFFGYKGHNFKISSSRVQEPIQKVSRGKID